MKKLMNLVHCKHLSKLNKFTIAERHRAIISDFDRPHRLLSPASVLSSQFQRTDTKNCRSSWYIHSNSLHFGHAYNNSKFVGTDNIYYTTLSDKRKVSIAESGVSRLILRNSSSYAMSAENGEASNADKCVKAVLIDLSGTLHIDDNVIDGSIEALGRLRKSGVQVKFVTNTTKESERALVERLQSLGFDIQRSEVFTSLTAARKLVEARKLRPMLLIDQHAQEDFTGVAVDNPNAVVVGLAPEHFDYKTMNDAFRLVLEGAPLIAIHKARYYKTTDNLSLGPGPFVVGLEYATDTTAEVVGKPEKSFFLEALSDLGCQPHETVVIGDDVRGDVGGAQNAGMLGILVKTGKYREGDEFKISPVPDAVCDDFQQAVNHILAII